MTQLLLIALRNLAQHTRRTLMLGGAIAGVTMLMVILFALSTGVRNTMVESATTLMTGHVNVAGFYKVTAGNSAPVVTHYPKVLEIVKREVPELDYISQRGRGWAKLISDTGSQQAGIGGIDIRNEPGFRKVVQVVEGNLDDLAQPNTLLVFEEQAKKLDLKVGDTVTISASTSRGTNNTADVRVVAIAKNIGLLSTFNVFVPDGTLRALYQLNDDTTGALLLYLKDIRQVKVVQERLRKVFKDAGYGVMEDNAQPFFVKFQAVNREDWTGQKIDVTNWEEEISFLQFSVVVIGALSFILIVILLFIICVGIINTLWIAIRERTREIGTLRAIGMQRRRVMAMFMIESFALAVLSTAAGVVLGVTACAALNAASVPVPKAVQLFLMSDHLNLVVDASGVVKSTLIIVVLTSIVAILPSYLAARLKPVTAMQHIG